MKVTIQLGPELYAQIRTLVHDELNEQKNRQRIEQVARKIRGQLGQLSGPKRFATGLKADLGTVFRRLKRLIRRDIPANP